MGSIFFSMKTISSGKYDVLYTDRLFLCLFRKGGSTEPEGRFCRQRNCSASSWHSPFLYQSAVILSLTAFASGLQVWACALLPFFLHGRRELRKVSFQKGNLFWFQSPCLDYAGGLYFSI